MRTHFVQILDIPDNFPTHFLDNGRLYLDLQPKFGFRLNKSRAELSEVDKIKDESTFTIVLPRTPKNDLVFASFILPNTPTQVSTYNIAAKFGAMILAQDIGVPIKLNDSDATIDFQLAKSEDFWLKSAKNLTIDKLDFGTFTYSKANIKATWDKGQFADGDQGVVLTNVDYGVTPVNEDGTRWEWRVAYFRPLVSLLDLLQKGFCEIGWQLDFPVLKTNWGRRKWCYLLKKDYWDQPGRGLLYRARVRSNDFDGAENGNSWVTIYDEGNNFDETLNFDNGAYQNQQEHPIEISMKLIFPAASQPYTGTDTFIENLTFWHNRPGVTIEQIDKEELAFEIDPTDLQNIEYQSKVFTLQPGDFLYAQLTQAPTFSDFPQNGFYMTAGIIWEFNVEGRRVYEGDTVQISNMLKPYPLLDVFKGAVGLGRFVIETDYNNRKVIVRPKLDATIGSQDVDGFLQDEYLDLTEKIVVKSRLRQSQAQLPRYAVFAFKKTSDRYIDTLGFDEESNPIFSREIDLGIGEVETTFIRNSFFEPTANVDHQELELPAMYDNDSGNESYNIGPRILHAVGRYKQVKGFSELSEPAQWIWEGEDEDEFLILSQDPKRQYFDGTTLTEPSGSVVYGNKPDDLFNTFIQSTISELVATPKDQYLAWLDINDFIKIDFRKRLLMYYEGQTFIAELLSVKDFDTSQDLPTIIECIPDRLDGVSFCVADYYLDLTRTFYQTVYSNGGILSIDSITLNGEVVGSNIELGNYDPVDIPLPSGCSSSESTHFRNLVNRINDLTLGDLYAGVSKRSLCPTPGAYYQTFKYHRLTYRSGATFEIVIKIKTSSAGSLQNFARLTESKNEFWNGSQWVEYTTSNIFEVGAQARIQIA